MLGGIIGSSDPALVSGVQGNNPNERGRLRFGLSG